MRCANLIDMVEVSDAALARLRKLSNTRARAEKAYRAAVAAERDEIAYLLESETAGPVVIAAAIGRTREAVRLSYRQWKKDRGHDDTTAS